MNPKIVTITAKHLVGMSSAMKQNEYHKIPQLWQRFMPQKRNIVKLLNQELLAVQVYENMLDFDKPFKIYAAAEVSNSDNLPDDMEAFTIPKGEYAVFLHKGMNAAKTYQDIMTKWLPQSGYAIDDRPHFQIMGAKYKNGSENSEEDFYVPIKLKI